MKVFIFGLGAIGSNIFVQLVKQYPEWSFVGVDFDKVEDRNLRTQAYFREHVGLKKTMALTSVGLRYVQKLRYVQCSEKITKNTKLVNALKSEVSDVWLDCFDTSESRKVLKEIVPKGVHLLHLGFRPLYLAECIWDEVYDVPGDVDTKQPDICAMLDACGFIQSFIGLSVMNINDWLQSGVKRNFIVVDKYKLNWL